MSENALTVRQLLEDEEPVDQARTILWLYDAAYVALAESRGAQFVTIDAELEKAPGIRCEIVRPR